MKPNTLEIINAQSEMTLKHQSVSTDAGANVHVLYPENDSEKFCNLLGRISFFAKMGSTFVTKLVMDRSVSLIITIFTFPCHFQALT
jgi:hypothetical protein